MKVTLMAPSIETTKRFKYGLGFFSKYLSRKDQRMIVAAKVASK